MLSVGIILINVKAFIKKEKEAEYEYSRTINRILPSVAT